VGRLDPIPVLLWQRMGQPGTILFTILMVPVVIMPAYAHMLSISSITIQCITSEDRAQLVFGELVDK